MAEVDSFVDDPPLRFPTVRLADALGLFLPQYAESSRLQALAAALVQVLEDEVVEPLQRMERAVNPDAAEGILLDWIGTRIGLPRPWVASADARFFGFRGTSASGGRTFGQAPFFTRRRGLELREPIGDATYRILLKGRARRLRGGADRETLEAVLAILFGNGHLDETGAAPVLRAQTDNDVLFALAQGLLFELLFPRPATVTMTLERIV